MPSNIFYILITATESFCYYIWRGWMVMDKNAHFSKNIKWKQYAYCICAIILTLFSFYFYASVAGSVYGLVLLLIQLAVFYCILNIFSVRTVGTVLIGLISTFILFLLMELINVAIPDFMFFNRFPISAFIVAIRYISLVCLAMLLYFVWERDTISQNKNCFHLLLCILIGVLICALKTDDMKTYQISFHIFLFVFFMLHFIFSYCVHYFSNSFLLTGNILLALYFASTQLYMVYFCTEEISNTGWAVSYVLFLAREYFTIHGSIALIVLLFAVTTKKWYQKKIYKTAK